MSKTSLPAIGRQLAHQAQEATSGRAAISLTPGHDKHLRHTLMYLTDGTSTSPHNGRDEATVHVLEGRIRLSTDDDQWDVLAGDLLPLPHNSHHITAHSDSLVLLTTIVVDE
ncbi:cupin domain-containing protein [Haloglycomyces albus]|uniref:cupin domain-containing protein n=1 Tax=Haloglycomyces albus TaxID=526067 RepID=UPI00046D3E89|nr:cupin domain-containing protein [Haloglycomyces albus]